MTSPTTVTGGVPMDVPRPVTLLLLALGGEGGGVLHDWIVDAAIEAGYPVQATSIPGVAQRTGATSYYIELMPLKQSALGDLQPVFCLSPTPGEIDLLVSSELLETARALERGLSSPARTTLISSTSRFLTVDEKSAMADGRWNAERLPDLARALSQRAVLFDMAAATQSAGTVISAVMFGAIAASGVLPLSREACEAMVRKSGRGVEASLKGFAAGWDAVTGSASARAGTDGPAIRGAGAPGAAAMASDEAVRPRASAASTAPQGEGAADREVDGVRLPAPVAEVAAAGVERLVDFQDRAYAQDYLRRIAGFVALERAHGGAPAFAASRSAARFLALWMAYEDVIRVADLKTRAARFERIRGEVGAKAGEPIVVRDFLKPGVDEIAAILPGSLAARVRAWGTARGRRTLSKDGIRLQTSSVAGTLAMRVLASLRGLRRRSSRFAEEAALIERWSQALSRALAAHPRLAREIAECPRLIKGYSDTFARGRGNFADILATLIEPPLPADAAALEARADAIRRARDAALADPEGRTLAQALGRPMPEPKAQPIRFVPMARKR